MKSTPFILIAAVATALVFGSAQAAKPEGKGKPEQSQNAKGNSGKSDDNGGHDDHGGKSDGRKGHDGKDLRYAGISRDDARRYADQYRVGGTKPLPPGIRKNLARGKPIPPGIAMTRLPQGYLDRLPRYPGYEWRGYGSDLVLVDALSNVIADVILDAFD
jgi:Ni/Co efflux regulator RcnB